MLSLLGKPCILNMYPNEGWTSGGTRITVIGLNFFEGLDVMFGTVPVPSEVSQLSMNIILLSKIIYVLEFNCSFVVIYNAVGFFDYMRQVFDTL